MDQPEVRYQMLRPAQVIERRKACPAVYIPIGILEWHGPQNPLGADALQAEGLAVACAQKGGGLVFPTLYYGETRSESLMEATAADRADIAREMDLPPENFYPDKQPFSPIEQVLNYQKLLLHILTEAESLGFAVGVLVAGHYPLIDHARASCLTFNQRHHSRSKGMLAWATVDYLLVADKYERPGDHAGGWETSHCMYLQPDKVDLSTLPPKGEKLVGIHYHYPPQESSAAFGKETLEAASEVAVKEVRHRLEHRDLYRVHGRSLQEGLWKKEQA
jgi:creatinine amidohydrolase